MFIFQKFDRTVTRMTEDNVDLIYQKCIGSPLLGFDTETDGLNIMKSKPFLVTFSVGDDLYWFNPTEKLITAFTNILLSCEKVFAHNVQYDYHMLLNAGANENYIRYVKFADSMAVARLTQYADDLSRLSLESIGTQYVDPTAKIGGKAIRAKIAEINRANKKAGITEEANYKTVYEQYPELMLNYALDDVVIMMEYVKKAWNVLKIVDPGLVTFQRECDLIPHVCTMERVGMKVDMEYLQASKIKMTEYRDRLYALLELETGKKFTVGQHDFIKRLFKEKFKVVLFTADEKSLLAALTVTKDEVVHSVVKTIIELRTIDKWISTYIDGKLNSVVDGRIHTSINNQGAVSGRVSSNLQQQPNDGFVDRDGNELFHPRKVFIADEGKTLVFMDFSQMELRVQAYYTLMLDKGDTNLCRAYIPFECKSCITGEKYDYKNKDHMSRWDSGEWDKIEDGKPWSALDLHAVTTFIAFPHLGNNPDHPEFKKLRKLGKMCNFLKNYQGGVNAIIEQMGVSEETARALDQAYYKAFPNVRDYQQWVTRELTLHGFTENLYGRRYYMQDSKWFYKAGNYDIQGSCADLVKKKEIEIGNYLLGKKSSFVLPVHDELVFSIDNDELDIIPDLHAILEDNADKIPWIPMLCEVSYSDTNWAEKKPWKGKL